MPQKKNKMGSEVEVISCDEDNGEKNVFRMDCFYERLHFSLLVTNGFYGIRFCT